MGEALTLGLSISGVVASSAPQTSMEDSMDALQFLCGEAMVPPPRVFDDARAVDAGEVRSAEVRVSPLFFFCNTVIHRL